MVYAILSVMHLSVKGLNTERQNGLRRYVFRNLRRTRPGGASGFVLLVGFDNREGSVRQSLCRVHNRQSYPLRVVQHQILECIMERRAVFRGAFTPPYLSLYPTAAWCDIRLSAGRLATTTG